MDPIQVLKDEHRRIERVLDALVRFAHSPEPDPSTLADFVRFFRGYVDALHHGKEEDLLFAALVEVGGMPTDMGPVAVMLDEHEVGRRAVATLSDIADQPRLEGEARARLVDTADGYAVMLRQHILKEDGVLYPLAETRLDTAVLEELGWQFERFAARHAEEADTLAALGDRLSGELSGPAGRGGSGGGRG